MDLPEYDSWKLEGPDKFDTQEEDDMTTEKRIDKKFQSLTRGQREAFRCLLKGLGAGMEQSDYYTRSKSSTKAKTIYEPCSVACTDELGESKWIASMNSTEGDRLVNSMFDTDGVLDQTLEFVLDKISAL